MDTERLLRELNDFLRIPSISTSPSHDADCRAAAEWVAAELRRLGCDDVQFLASETHPVVWGVGPDVPGAPTLLVYGHYDVQPPDPLNEWISPPFEPTRRDGNLFARGATDDKGQMFTHVLSTGAWLATAGKLPLKLKFLIEGEEEVASDNLEIFIESHRDRLACNVVVISDTSQYGPDQPAITYGLRGIAYFELRLTGPRQDLH